MPALINPSILSADFANLERDLQAIATADYVHVDVMDNHFVPNLTIGLPVVQRIQAVSPVPLDAHLMIADADRWAPGFADAGLASVTFHAEASIAPIKLARELRSRGAKAGMALRPATPVEPYLDMLPELDTKLCGCHRKKTRTFAAMSAFVTRAPVPLEAAVRTCAAVRRGVVACPAHSGHLIPTGEKTMQSVQMGRSQLAHRTAVSTRGWR